MVAEATRVLETVSAASTDVELKLEAHDFGGCSIDKSGEPLTESTLQACKSADAILMGEVHLCFLTVCAKSDCAHNSAPGAIGGPKWGVNSKVRPEQGLLELRKALGLYANIRPANFASDSLLAHSPLKPSVAQGVDIIVGGIAADVDRYGLMI